MKKMFSFDPGLTTGWVLWNYETGDLLDKGQIHFDRIFNWFYEMEGHLPETIIVPVEDFRLMNGKEKAQIGSRFETVQVIGAIRLWLAPHRIEMFLQPASIKPIAERWTGLKPTGAHNKNSHWVDAYNHGAYYLRSVGHYTTALEGGGYVEQNR
jgi:hypothetical protein